jgi:flagellar biosynthetic protein FliR
MSADQLIAQFGQQNLLAFMLVLGRISPLFVMAPLFSMPGIPPRVKGVVAVGLAIGIAPIARHAAKGQALPDDVWTIGGLMVKEVLVGLAFAFVIGALFAAMAAAGSLLDTIIGFSLGGVLDPLTGTQSSVLSQLYALVGVMVFIAIGGDGWVIEGLARTYDAVPLTEAPQIGSLTAGVQMAFSDIAGASIQVCAPVLLALILTDVALGVVSRVVPQLNVFAVGFPLKAAVGLLMIGVSLPFAAGWLSDQLQQSVSSALQMLKVA